MSGSSDMDMSDVNAGDILPESLLSSASQLSWFDQQTDDINKRTLPVLSDTPLEYPTPFPASALVPDGLEPGEVVSDDGGVAPSAPKNSSAHNLFNSYAFNPWKRFQGALSSGSQALSGELFERSQLLQCELKHLRSAVEEKSREIGELTRDIQEAYKTITELRRLVSERTDEVASYGDEMMLEHEELVLDSACLGVVVKQPERMNSCREDQAITDSNNMSLPVLQDVDSVISQD